MKKKLWKALLLLSVAAMCIAAPAQAATKKKGIVTFSYQKNADRYKNADVTGDGKADLVEWIQNNGKETLKVNDAVVKSWGKNTGAWAHIAVVGKTGYLLIGTEVAGGKTSWGIYQVKNGKLASLFQMSSVINKQILFKNSFVYNADAYDMVAPSKVVGSTLYADFKIGTKAMGQLSIQDLKISLKDGKPALQTAIGKAGDIRVPKEDGLTNTFTASRKFNLMKKAGSSKIAGAVTKGTTFTLEKGVIIKKNIYILVNTGKLRGWVTLGQSQLVKAKALLIWG